MILDYKNDLDFACENGISIHELGKDNYYIYFKKDVKGEKYSEIIFKNFPNLYMADSKFEKCVFENCGDVEFSKCKVEESVFESTTIHGIRSDFYNSEFKNIEADDLSALLIDTDGEVIGCKFENVVAKGDEGRVCYMVVDKEKDMQYLVDCKFINCSVEVADGSLSLCNYRGLLGKQKYVENIDYDSCEIV